MRSSMTIRERQKYNIISNNVIDEPFFVQWKQLFANTL